MTVGVGASGFVGIAAESVSGTYVAPVVYSLLKSESLNHAQSPYWRRPLRGIADVYGVASGQSSIAGDVSFEVTEDELVYWLKGSRTTLVKTGAGPYIYTYVGNASALPTATLSLTVVRNGVVFGYVGCVVSQLAFSIDSGTLVCTMSIVGRSEATQSLPTPTYPTQVPFGVGQYRLEIPTASQVFDADTFTLTINENAEGAWRLTDVNTAPQFFKYGERSVEMSINRDFQDRTDFDAFKILTAQAILLKALKSANQYVQFTIPAAIKNTYEIQGLSGQADLIRANIAYIGTYDSGTSKSFEIKVSTATNIT